MRSMEGVVTIVQEGRFQLLDDSGVSHLFILDHSATLEPEQLPPLQREQTRVRVSYRAAHGLLAHMAEKLVLVDRRQGE
jgi:hypothetical protein